MIREEKEYLNIKEIVRIAKMSGANAIHPGYGFLSENFKFADEIKKANLIFIGPHTDALKSMASKSASKIIMEKAGVPCVPGYHGENQMMSHLLLEADKINYPIMIKAVLGGGGKGMRIATSKDDFEEMVFSSKRESLKSFGDDRILLERYIKNPRHIEVQIFGDNYGNVVYLWERDCSLQRRHQKIIEEAPAPLLSMDLRKKLGQMAVEAAKAVKYSGAGTVEFIFDCDTGEIFFMEMNTRLQVEHPVTEMITGLDLVHWQLHVASGNPLPLKQVEIPLNHSAIEARINAEKTQNSFLPDSGKISVFELPESTEDVRVDCGIKKGDVIGLNYDPMIAKVIGRGEDRLAAIRRLDKALESFLVYGVKTNISFTRKVLQNPNFIKGGITTSFIEDNRSILFKETEMKVEECIMAPIIHILLCEKEEQLKMEWDKNDLFSTTESKREMVLEIDGKELIWKVEIGECVDSGFRYFKVNRMDVIVVDWKKTNDLSMIDVISNGISFTNLKIFEEEDKFTIFFKDKERTFTYKRAHENISKEKEGPNHFSTEICSPMPSKITQIPVKEGDQIAKGKTIIVLEAMKMESMIVAPSNLTIKTIFFKEGDVVAEGDILIEFERK